MIDLEYDDFGERNGKRFFDGGGLAMQLARSWRVADFGQRPIDWSCRDLIIGGAQRDARNWALRQLMKNRHPRFFDGTQGLSKRDRNSISRARSFLFFHYLSLVRLSNVEDTSVAKRAGQLINCCPNLYLVEPSAQNRVLQPCKQNKFCPFCLARTAKKVAQRFRESANRDTIFILASVQRQVASLFRAGRSVVPAFRRECSVSLRALAQDIGAERGVFAFQVGPHSEELPKFRNGEIVGTDKSDSFNLRAAILIELPIDSFCLVPGLETQRLESIPAFEPLLELGTSPEVVVAADYGRDPIRSLVFGDAPGSENGSGHAGLFAYQQWHLATVSQWAQYFEAVRGQRLFTFWGDSVSPPTPSPSKRLTPASSRRGAYRQRRARAAANWQRKQVADDEALALISRLEPLAVGYRQRSGNWPGRSMIQKLAAQESISVSERLARRIAGSFQARELD
ncbi:MAG: hypothetical protein H6824_03545 [Planctomycetaceae bacterium]|nr:hypothetical protein [Planctomycetaceae bacterium]